MKRRGFLGKVAGGAVAGVSLPMGAQVGGEGSLVKTAAVVMAPREDGVEVVWAVSELAKGRVEWKGVDAEAGVAKADRFGTVVQGDEILRVRLEGLKPGTDYQLRAITESADGKRKEAGAWKAFRTLSSKSEATKFSVWNDTHQNEETLKKLHEMTPASDFLIWNGDTCNDWHQEDWLVPTLLSPGGQDVSRERPLMLVWGNHDVRGKWAYRVPEMIATPEGRPYYAFRSGPVAVVCLHTGEDKPDDHPSFGGRVAFDELRREQAEWLAELIERPGFKDAPYRMVFCHIPLRWTKEVDDVGYERGGYDAYSRRSRDAWHESLVKWGCQVVVSGHTHQPAWIPADEVFPYAQLVSGGPQPERARWIEGVADRKSLRLTMKDLSGGVTAEYPFAPEGA